MCCVQWLDLHMSATANVNVAGKDGNNLVYKVPRYNVVVKTSTSGPMCTPAGFGIKSHQTPVSHILFLFPIVSKKKTIKQRGIDIPLSI